MSIFCLFQLFFYLYFSFKAENVEVGYIDDDGLFKQANKEELESLINELPSFNADQQMEIIQ